MRTDDLEAIEKKVHGQNFDLGSALTVKKKYLKKMRLPAFLGTMSSVQFAFATTSSLNFIISACWLYLHK